ncbi:MAG: Glutamate synthase (NADPH) small chain [Syntrophorhabdaceae bacterium PtaU1.Bin034]|nr:MAG: Glutamate synthase (NADPH) small chain [Syntrophorhabdaceae bacterium PtaU1.Bin034]
MKGFNHVNAATFEEACDLLNKSRGTAQVMAGGTDLLGIYKDRILEEYPETVVNLKTIPGIDRVEECNGALVIGAGCKLGALEKLPLLRKAYPALAEAARSVASPLIRNLATIGGNICQDVRCWYYRYPDSIGGRLKCLRKGGDTCYAVKGENRYHSVFGGMHAHATPCMQQCPAGTDISGYMGELRKGNLEAAARIIMQYNPMPMITGRVCAHWCHGACNRRQYDERVAIGSVERFVGDYVLEYGDLFYTAPETSTGKSVAVVGSGPSGLAAAYYLRQAGNEVTVYDQKKEAGGMLRYTIPAYRLPKDIVRRFVAALAGMGVKFILETTIGRDVDPVDLGKKYDSVYYATGAWKRPLLGLAGEDLTVFGLDFLMEVSQWMQGKVGTDVLVTGGGNVAMDVAVTAKRLGAKNVTLACLEAEGQMPASEEEIERAREEGIVIMTSWGVDRVLEESGKVQGMKLKRCVSVFDEKGAFNPQYDERETFVVKAQNILMAVGQQADLSFLSEKFQMQLDRRGLIEVSEETQMTSRDGVFAGGDVTTGPASVIKAIAAGHNAARGMCRYLGVALLEVRNGHSKFTTFDPDGIEQPKMAREKERALGERSLDKEDSFGLEAAEATNEAKRCMDCACYSVNPSDIAPVLVMLGAEVVTTERTLSAEEFLTTRLRARDNLGPGELVKEIRVPKANGVAHYDKFRVRDAIDFAIVSLASRFETQNGVIRDARVVFGGVAPVPYRAIAVEEYLKGKTITEALAAEAAELSVKEACFMRHNEYKLHNMKYLLKQAILRALQQE